MQLSFFDDELPKDFDGFYQKVKERLAQPHDEPGVISRTSSKSGVGYSILFYQTVVFRLRIGKLGQMLIIEDSAIAKGQTLRFAPIAKKTVSKTNGKHTSYTFVLDAHFDLEGFISYLMACKTALFRSLGSETFTCCNDFLKCSDRKACIHPHEILYNHCYYRSNLEKGLIFYGKNANR